MSAFTRSEPADESPLRVDLAHSIHVGGTAAVGAISPLAHQTGRAGIHPSRPFAAVVAKGSFGWRWAEGFPPRLPVNLYNQKSHVLSAAMCAMSESR